MKSGIIGLGIGLVSATALIAASAPAYAQQAEARREFNIPAQPLASALIEFSRQSDIVVTAPARLTRQRSAPAVRGTYTPREALQALLAGSGLAYRVNGGGSFIIEQRTETTQRETPLVGEAQSTAEAVAGGPADYGESEEILVTGTRIRGISNKTVPLEIIGKEEIARTGYSTTQELFRSLPKNFAGGDAGLSEDGTFGIGAKRGLNPSSATGINLRGLGNSSTLVLLNGYRIAPSAYGTAVDISHIPLPAIDRVEILTDGSSALYGADAVAGVVNIRLLSDYDGAETKVRYGFASDGGREELTASQTAGDKWDGGSALASFQYQSFDSLSARNRDSTRRVILPTDIYPETSSISGLFSIRQEVSERFSLFGNSLLSRRHVERVSSSTSLGGATSESKARDDSLNFTGGFRYSINPDWSVAGAGSFSSEDTSRDGVSTTVQQGIQVFSNQVRYRETSAEANVSGRIFDLPGGPLSVAFGAAYRKERLNFTDVLTSGFVNTNKSRREVVAAFAEAYAPLIDDDSGIPLLGALDLSAAVRVDDYSDFGTTVNPRLGIRWSPATALNLRGSYSKSFRAPSALERVSAAAAPTAVIFDLDAPTGMGTVPTIVFLGGGVALKPERAKILSLGAEYEPAWLAGLRLSVSYYDIRYRDRIATPALDFLALTQPEVYGALTTVVPNAAAALAIRDAVLAAGGVFFNASDLGAADEDARFALNFRQQNVAILQQSGIDFSASYTAQSGSNTLNLGVDASYIDHIRTRVTPGSAPFDSVDTFGSPLRFRSRAFLGWGAANWSLNGFVNHMGGYRNTTVLAKPRIRSWTTVDASFRMNIGGGGDLSANGLTIGASVQNLLNSGPPFAAVPGLDSVDYDGANANPLGRVIAFEISKRW